MAIKKDKSDPDRRMSPTEIDIANLYLEGKNTTEIGAAYVSRNGKKKGVTRAYVSMVLNKPNVEKYLQKMQDETFNNCKQILIKNLRPTMENLAAIATGNKTKKAPTRDQIHAAKLLMEKINFGHSVNNNTDSVDLSFIDDDGDLLE